MRETGGAGESCVGGCGPALWGKLYGGGVCMGGAVHVNYVHAKAVGGELCGVELCWRSCVGELFHSCLASLIHLRKCSICYSVTCSSECVAEVVLVVQSRQTLMICD